MAGKGLKRKVELLGIKPLAHHASALLQQLQSNSSTIFEPFTSHFKGLRTVVARLRSLIKSSLISSRTNLIAVLTIGLSAVIMLKFHPHQGYKGQ